MSEPTEYDELVDQKTGRIDLSGLCNMLGSGLWGLVFAKARASFKMSDVVDRKQLKSKYNKIFYTCILVIVAQTFKSLADSHQADIIID